MLKQQNFWKKVSEETFLDTFPLKKGQDDISTATNGTKGNLTRVLGQTVVKGATRRSYHPIRKKTLVFQKK